jgi:hypothetical protein
MNAQPTNIKQKTNNILFQTPYGYCVHDKHCVASTTGLRQDFGNFFTLGLLLGHTPLSRDQLPLFEQQSMDHHDQGIIC